MSDIGTSTDRVETHVVIRASRARVWQALSNPQQLGLWLGAVLEGSIAAGHVLRGPVTEPGYEGLTLTLHIERVEPERSLAYRWHPCAIDPTADYSREPMTLVEFTLADVGDDADARTQLTVVESGFDRLPAARRSFARRMNGDGWAEQMARVARLMR